jgi:uncharacterized protein YbaP (TraB family)
VVKSKDAKLYLFGTIHLLPPDANWRTPALQAALAESQEVWLEIALDTAPGAASAGKSPLSPEAQQEAQQLILKLGMDLSGPPLSSHLSPVEADQLAEYARVMGAPMAAVDRMRPWLAATVVTAALAKQVGWTDLGPDVKLDQDARAAGKSVQGFETLEKQAHFFADMPPDQELAYLKQTLSEAAKGKADLEKMGKLWMAGDDAGVAREDIADLKAKEPALYQRLIVERNKAWMPQIEALLKTPGVRLVAVGDGHILGPDGVAAMLKADGYSVEKVK